MGFIAVAHLAARHGIAVTLGTPPGGGTSAEIYLPAPLMSPEVKLPGWMGPSAAALRPAAGARAGGPDGDPLCSAPRFAAGPEPAPELQPRGSPGARSLGLGFLAEPGSAWKREQAAGAVGPRTVRSGTKIRTASSPTSPRS
jgi:hypothetical protein